MKSKNLEWRIDRLVYVRGGEDQPAPRDRKHIERAEPEMLRLIKVRQPFNPKSIVAMVTQKT